MRMRGWAGGWAACVDCCLVELAFQKTVGIRRSSLCFCTTVLNQFAASTAATADRKPFNTARAVILLISNDST